MKSTTSDIIMYLPNNISYLRNKYGYSTTKLAYMLNYKSGSTITNWESGIRIPDVWDVWKLSQIFFVDIDDLLKKDLRFSDEKTDEDQKREGRRNNSINNLKKLSAKDEKEILDVVEILIKNKLINLNDEGNDNL